MKAQAIGAASVDACCQRHGHYTARRLVILGKEIVTRCPECEEERERLLGDAEDSQKAQALAMAAMNIEPEFYHASLENYAPKTAGQAAALAACRAIVEGGLTELILTGPNGAGKTHLACAVAIRLRGAVYTAYEISCMVRETFSPAPMQGEGKTELAVISRLAGLPFLAIDELGRSKGSEAERNWLSHIISKRHSRYLPTMLISNRPLANGRPAWQARGCLDDFIGSDIICRFRRGVAISLEEA